MLKPDPIIDRSPEQKQMRVDKLTSELLDLGYSVVRTEWLLASYSDLHLLGSHRLNGKLRHDCRDH